MYSRMVKKSFFSNFKTAHTLESCHLRNKPRMQTYKYAKSGLNRWPFDPAASFPYSHNFAIFCSNVQLYSNLQ